MNSFESPVKPRQVGDYFGAILACQTVALVEGVQILARRELARLSGDLLGAHGRQFGRQFLMVPGRHDQAGQQRYVLSIAAGSVGAHGHREKHDAMHRDLVFIEIGG